MWGFFYKQKLDGSLKETWTKFVSPFDMKVHFSEGKGDRFSKGDQHTQKTAYILWFTFFRHDEVSFELQIKL